MKWRLLSGGSPKKGAPQLLLELQLLLALFFGKQWLKRWKTKTKTKLINFESAKETQADIVVAGDPKFPSLSSVSLEQ